VVVTRRQYTKRQKVTAVMAAEMTNVKAAARKAGIPEQTVRYWFDDPDFAVYRAKTREDIAPEAIAIIHEALAIIRRKLDQFEPRDLTVLVGVLTDKAQLLVGKATTRTETIMSGMDDHERDVLREILTEATKVEA
jgi:hypothetical protein